MSPGWLVVVEVSGCASIPVLGRLRPRRVPLFLSSSPLLFSRFILFYFLFYFNLFLFSFLFFGRRPPPLPCIHIIIILSPPPPSPPLITLLPIPSRKCPDEIRAVRESSCGWRPVAEAALGSRQRADLSTD